MTEDQGDVGGKVEWKDKSQMKAQKSMAMAERRLTKTDLDGRGSPVEP